MPDDGYDSTLQLISHSLPYFITPHSRMQSHVQRKLLNLCCVLIEGHVCR
jgi:hypothetical protein